MRDALLIEPPAGFEPVVPKRSATIILMRDIASSFEMFMIARAREMDFMPGALVFPGGGVSVRDATPGLLARTRGIEGLPLEEAILVVTAIRETFEEAGVLLARAAGASRLLDGKRTAALAEKRAALNARQLDFDAFIEAEDLTLAGDLLVRLSRWVTPWWYHKRFDAQFFLAVAPEGQLAEHDGREAVNSHWITPRQALVDADAGKHPLVPATRSNVDWLARQPTVKGAFSAAAALPMTPVHPRIEKRAEGYAMVTDPGAGFIVIERPAPALASLAVSEALQDAIRADLLARGVTP